MTTRSTLGLDFLKFVNLGVTNCNIESTSNGIITLSSQSGNVIIRGVADPVNNQDVVTKSYVSSNYMTPVLTSGNMYVGNNSNVATGVVMSGDATISNSGVVTVTQSPNATNTGITDDTTTSSTVYPTWVTGTSGNLPQKISSTKMNFVPSSGSLILSGPCNSSEFSTTSGNSYGMIRSSGAQSIPVTTNTLLSNLYWNNSSVSITGDTNGGTISYNNNGRWTVNKTGIYIISYSVSFSSSPTGSRSVSVRIDNPITTVNGLAYINSPPITNPDRTGISSSIVIKIDNGQQLYINVSQTSGAPLNMDTAILGFLSIYRIS